MENDILIHRKMMQTIRNQSINNYNKTNSKPTLHKRYKEKENSPNYCYDRIYKQKKQGQSFDTCQSDRETHSKLKVQLCKNFVEKGYCPYQSRCRFAHGIQQLRGKDTGGSSDLYRTRKCKIFFERLECKFGQRCNFKHCQNLSKKDVDSKKKIIKTCIRLNFLQLEIIQNNESSQSSRLMKLIQ